MSVSTSNPSSASEQDRDHLQFSVIAFVMGALSFFIGSAIFTTLGGTPPSSTPLVSIAGHALWFVSVAFVTSGAIALLLSSESLQAGLAGYFAIGPLGLSVLHGLQWATWIYVDILAVQNDQYELILDTLISPFGAGHAFMYVVLVGSGVAFLGWSGRRTDRIHRYGP